MQKTLRLKNYQRNLRQVPEFAEVVGLSSEDQVVTLRFMGEVKWGEPARQIRLNRKLAEELSRLLANELEDY